MIQKKKKQTNHLKKTIKKKKVMISANGLGGRIQKMRWDSKWKYMAGAGVGAAACPPPIGKLSVKIGTLA